MKNEGLMVVVTDGVVSPRSCKMGLKCDKKAAQVSKSVYYLDDSVYEISHRES